MTALATVLLEMSRWERAEGRACAVIRCSPALMAEIKLEAHVWPVGPRGDLGYLERVPGVPAEWLVDPVVEGHVCAFEPMPNLFAQGVS